MLDIIYLLLIGLLAGTVSGFIGIGGGIVIIPSLVMLLGFSQKMAQGTSLGLLLPPLGILAVINYYKAGFVDFRAVAIMSVTFVIGTYFASKAVVEIPESIIRKIFASFLIIYSVKLFLQK